ncbi:hypothetical protein CHUAL_001218 [Chamberlinius hualienensis]
MKTKRISTSLQLLEKSGELGKVKKSISKGAKSLKKKQKKGLKIELEALKKGKLMKKCVESDTEIFEEKENIDDEVVEDCDETKEEIEDDVAMVKDEDTVNEEDKMIVDENAITSKDESVKDIVAESHKPKEPVLARITKQLITVLENDGLPNEQILIASTILDLIKSHKLTQLKFANSSEENHKSIANSNRNGGQCEILKNAALYWTALKSNDVDKRVEIANLIYDQIKGRVVELASLPDKCRILKSLFIQESEDFKSKLFDELKDDFNKLTMNFNSKSFLQIVTIHGTLMQRMMAIKFIKMGRERNPYSANTKNHENVYKQRIIENERPPPLKETEKQQEIYNRLSSDFFSYLELQKENKTKEATKVIDGMYGMIKGNVLKFSDQQHICQKVVKSMFEFGSDSIKRKIFSEVKNSLPLLLYRNKDMVISFVRNGTEKQKAKVKELFPHDYYLQPYY